MLHEVKVWFPSPNLGLSLKLNILTAGIIPALRFPSPNLGLSLKSYDRFIEWVKEFHVSVP